MAAVLMSACGVAPQREAVSQRDAPVAAAPAAPSASQAGSQARRAPVRLPAPSTPRTWNEARRQAAQRMVAANPGMSYTDKPPFMLLAIPVLTIELHADGSVRHISVMRQPSQARDTVQLAMEAIRNAAPFGSVAHLPKPWRFNETFLFRQDRSFKPMTLDQP